MARDHGRINWSIWGDQDWRTLGQDEQWLFMMALTQPGLSYTGVVPYTVRRWSQLAAGLSVGKLRKTVDRLASARYIVVDEDAEEFLIRSFIRNDGLLDSPNVVRSMVKDFSAVSSPVLRAVIVCEVFRLLSEIPRIGNVKSWEEVLTPWLVETLPRTFGEGFPGYLTQTQLLTLETVEKGTLDETISSARAAPSPAITPAPRGGLSSSEGFCQIHRLAEPCNGCAGDRKGRS